MVKGSLDQSASWYEILRYINVKNIYSYIIKNARIDYNKDIYDVLMIQLSNL